MPTQSAQPDPPALPAVSPAGSGDAETPLLFEVSWEACAQAGGIYTVLRSKAPAMVRRWGDAYWLIGPYREASARIEFEPQAPSGPLQEALHDLHAKGVRFHAGRWLVTGRPQVLLLDLDSVRSHAARMKYFLWKDNGVSSPDGDTEYDDIVAFGFTVADFLLAVQRRIRPRLILGHFHEWQGAVAVPVLRHRQAPVATVFTTHATLAGRNLCAANANIYDHLGNISAGRAAVEHGYAHRHALEGAAPQAADVFTTVSGLTALEAEQFLGRRPDVLLPNGLNVERFAPRTSFRCCTARPSSASTSS